MAAIESGTCWDAAPARVRISGPPRGYCLSCVQKLRACSGYPLRPHRRHSSTSISTVPADTAHLASVARAIYNDYPDWKRQVVDDTLRDYWILVRGHRDGDRACLLALELLAFQTGPVGAAAARYCKKHAA
jgi:hypothetical protein